VKAPIPSDEAARLEALQRYAILDTAPEAAFDRLTSLAARILNVPMVLVTLIDAERQWFKSTVGFSDTETQRDTAFCAHAILADIPLVVSDAHEDPRFADNPYVLGSPHIRFYAGAPLRTPDGFRLGTFCALDSKPRALSEPDKKLLEDLAALAMDELELRRVSRALASHTTALETALRDAERHRRLFERIAHTTPEVIYVFDLELQRNVYVNRDGADQLGYSAEQMEALGSRFLPSIMHPEDLPKVLATQATFDTIGDDERVEHIYRVKNSAGMYRWMRAHENVFSRRPDGRAKEILGVATDITALKESQMKLAALSITDELTGVPNKRAFRQRLEQLLEEARRGRKFVLCLADVDHFKRVNDEHGHPMGDKVLATVAKTLADHVRKVDHVARYGGEEFAVLFVDVDLAAALTLAERLRYSVAAVSDPLRVTASFGVAQATPESSAASLLKAADTALYQAKHAGRNRVVPSAE
jgi:diguanylate cyclase (GGDEF)-like protein/PAS domain S-box-containing protein